ncbi:flagellar protein FlhE [Acerihabitans sp.]|uniref:flagellar protein FlhE n=1 Tax=Acerihabitans sp. TaxID=2811394 RepID=UPI002ED8652F
MARRLLTATLAALLPLAAPLSALGDDASAGVAPAPVSSGHQGGWQGIGHMLVLTQRGSAKSSPPMRPFAPLPAGVRVTSVNWRIDTGRPLPSHASLSLCMPGKCVDLDGLSGRSDAFAGQPADNPVTLVIQVAGRGTLSPPPVLNRFQVLVNYQGEFKR